MSNKEKADGRERVLLPSAWIRAVASAIAYRLFGINRFNEPPLERYPVRGVDVSSHNGTIDWPLLAKQGLSFVFIKATEGSDFVDRRFVFNYDGAQAAALRVGAYHFFSYTSAGRTQAENFIRTVPKSDGMLPPVIDVEIPPARKKNPPDAAKVRQELSDMIALMTAHYGMPPMLYASRRAYRVYRLGEYAACDIWMRGIFSVPRLPDGRDWTFWQYADKTVLPGYTDGVAHIDCNVFCGSAAEFSRYIEKKTTACS